MKRNRIRNLNRQKYTDSIFTVAKHYDIASTGAATKNALCQIEAQLNYEITQIYVQVSIGGTYSMVRTQTQISNQRNLNRCYFNSAGTTNDFGAAVKYPTGIFFDRLHQFSQNSRDWHFRLTFFRTPLYLSAGDIMYIHSWTDCEIANTIGILTKVIVFAGRRE